MKAEIEEIREALQKQKDTYSINRGLPEIEQEISALQLEIAQYKEKLLLG